jgi:hypothetical protein
MRNRTVQSKVVSKCQMLLCPAPHHHEPARGFDFDLNAVRSAVFLYGIQEYARAVKHDWFVLSGRLKTPLTFRN